MSWLRLFFGFKGRINRAQYWGAGILVNIIFYLASAVIASPLAGAKSPGEVMAGLAGFGLLIVPLSIIAIWVGLALQVKRLHDRNRSAWVSLLMFAPMFPAFSAGFSAGAGGDPADSLAALGPMLILGAIIGIGFFIDLGCLPGTPGPNRYGDPPGTPSPTTVTVLDGAAPAPTGAGAVNTRLQGAEAALARAIEERSKPAPPPSSFADLRTGRPAPAPQPAPRMAPPATAPAGFGRRGL